LLIFSQTELNPLLLVKKTRDNNLRPLLAVAAGDRPDRTRILALIADHSVASVFDHIGRIAICLDMFELRAGCSEALGVVPEGRPEGLIAQCPASTTLAAVFGDAHILKVPCVATIFALHSSTPRAQCPHNYTTRVENANPMEFLYKFFFFGIRAWRG
jgi:hypothetical protein